MFGISGLIVVVALGFSQVPKPAHNLQGYTTLWLLPGAESQQNTITLGISNQELDLTHYKLRLTLDSNPVKEWPDISLAPGQQWEQSIPMPALHGLVEADLFNANNPGVVYRYVTLTLKKQGN